ncbi:tripartite-type tricarboxylate transporter receptor subunit TctC [Jezberella montanilacus]|uniref:Tripartite-type tricarboxylate transporter receptor subunit TctC n=1 Tax=Jezberella montanilacus TaxID=323426 RepID=A0A2T0XKV0_9BURK|nr:tripartite tricarboxylate transporter substrate binding protein [Jezberella montanilacus]PRY99584.1 tripartite-type tricarboxylate transporter receptor subunit TctC [Jezberella montanilacus]
MNRRIFTQVSLGALLLSAFNRSQAQQNIKSASGFPDRPIKLVVPYPAGGVVDIVMRAVTEPLSYDLAQRIVVENRPGADGRIGIDAVAKAPADGYTLIAATPILAVGEHLMAEMKGRSSEFAGVCAFAAPPSVFVVNSDVPATTLKEFIELARKKPGFYNAANPSTGSTMHLAQELFFEHAGITLTNVNYKGQPQSLPDLGQGSVHFGLLSQDLALTLIQTGKVRPLAMNMVARTRALPEVPTVAQAGFPDILVRSWYGVAVPAATPMPVRQFLDEQFQRNMKLPAVREKLDAMECEILGLDGAHFDELIQSEYKRWGELIRARNIHI